MGARFWRKALGLVPGILLLTWAASAQSPTDKALPNPPAPVAGYGSATARRPAGAGIMPACPSAAAGLTVREKYALAYQRIVSFQMPLKAVVISGFELAAGTGPDFPSNGWSAFGTRVGYNALSISATTFISTALVPSLVHQDPRYFPLGRGPVGSRIGWAVRSEFVGFGDDGHTMPNYANLVGLGLSSILADAYLPRSSVGVRNTVEAYGIRLSAGLGLNVAREFGAFHKLKGLARHATFWSK